MPGPLRAQFLARAHTLTVSAKQAVITERTRSSDVYLITAGRLQFSLVSPGGREVVLREMDARTVRRTVERLTARLGPPTSPRWKMASWRICRQRNSPIS